MDPDVLRRRYDEIAAAYDRVMGRWARQDIPALLSAANVRPGSRVLDVATGTGEVALAVAAAVGRSGSVVGVDLSFGMLMVARQKTAELRVPFVVMDAQALACSDEVFDAVICRAALPLFPDVDRGLREFQRVLRIGGRLAVSVWPQPERVPIYGMFHGAVARQLPEQAQEIMIGFSLSDNLRVEGLFRTAGFTDVRVVSDVRELHFESFDDYWKPFETGGSRVSELYHRLPAEKRRAVRDEVRQRAAQFESAGRLAMTVESLFALARRS
jgi:ubiquinone/menaquinone biosynthesis C-methylase UbiE